jgi:N4-gp56 family major capsid protein
MSFLPPGVQSGTLAGFPQVAYERAPVLEWQANTPFLAQLCDMRPMPKRSGRVNQFYGQKPYVAASATLNEGIPGPSLNLSQVVSQVFMNQYGDWVGISDIVNDMFISPVAIDATRNLGYRGALTANLVTSNQFDATATADSTSRIDLQDNEYFIANTLRRAETSLVNNNVPGRDGGMYTGVLSPLVSFDLFADNSSGSAVDVMKRSESGYRELRDGIVRGYQIIEWAGCRMIRTTTVPSYSNYPSSGKTGYGSMIVGREAMLASELQGVNAPRDPNYKVVVKNLTEVDLSNPMLQTAAIVSYKYFLGVVARPNTNGTAGFRRVRSEVSITQ